jgi:hypothetical protein
LEGTRRVVNAAKLEPGSSAAKRTPRAKGAGASAAAQEPAPASATPTPSLARELALLGAARESLRNAQPAAALATLAQLEREAPAGALREERLAAQALASCALAQKPRGREYLAKLLALAPSSPLIARVRAACDEAEPQP